jgi:F-type H+-transporting ATPase subunit c
MAMVRPVRRTRITERFNDFLIRPWHVCGSEGKKQHNKKGNYMLPIIAELSGNLTVGLAALGSAIGVGIIGMKAAEATGRNPGAAGEVRNIAIILAALAEGITFFAIYLAK